MYYENWGTIKNTTVNYNGTSMNFHYNSMNPWINCNSYGDFSSSCFGYGYSFYGGGYSMSPKAALGFGLSLALPNLIGGFINLFKRN